MTTKPDSNQNINLTLFETVTFKKNSKLNVCLFIHFGTNNQIPHSVKIYLNELANYFDKIIFLTNIEYAEKQYRVLNKKIIPHFDKNRGYDFGRIYNYLNKLNLDKYSQIACVNDSNILLNKLDKLMNWGNPSNLDFWGIIDSNEKPWFSEHANNYHIQSHFIVFNRKAINKLPAFFDSIDMALIFNEKENKELRRIVINNWEIGLTQFFIKTGLSCGSYINSREYFQKHRFGKPINVTHRMYNELIKNGYPLFKKKVVTKISLRDQFRFQNNWKKTIREYGNLDWQPEKLINELIQNKKNPNRQEIKTLSGKFN